MVSHIRIDDSDIPSRLSVDSDIKWTTINTLDELEGWQVGAAIVPAAIIAILFYFDHNVSAQLAQVAEFQLKKPTAYHWDFFMLGIMTLVW